MSNIIGKIEGKLHIDGRKENPGYIPHTYGQHTGYAVGGPAIHVAGGGVHGYGYEEKPQGKRLSYGESIGQPGTLEGPIGKIKRKVKGAKGKVIAKMGRQQQEQLK